MDARQTPEGVVLTVKVRTGRPAFRLNDEGIIEVRARPERGEANREIIKGLGKMFGCEARIISGLKSRKKSILLVGIGIEMIKSMA